MTPFASVAILEKLALLKIALCKAPPLSSASSACLRAEMSLITTRMTGTSGSLRRSRQQVWQQFSWKTRLAPVARLADLNVGYTHVCILCLYRTDLAQAQRSGFKQA